MKLKRKNILYFLMIGIALIVGTNDVKATIDGDANTGGGKVKGNCELYEKTCCYKNSKGNEVCQICDGCWDGVTEGIRITIVDKNGNRIPGTNSVDYLTEDAPDTSFTNVYYNANKNDRKEVISKKNIDSLFTKQDFSLKKLEGIENFIGKNKGSYFEEFFKNKMSNANFKKMVLDATGYSEKVSTDNELCQKVANTYFIIEPITLIKTTSVDGKIRTYLGTGTELISLVSKYSISWLDGGGFARRNIPYSIYLNENLVGYKSADPKSYSDETRIEHEKSLNREMGFSVGAFRININGAIDCNPEPEEYTCYSVSKTCSDTPCSNTNSSNNRHCYSSVSEFTTKNLSDCNTSNKKSGEYTYELINGVCDLYCTEASDVYYPGNVRPAIIAGTSLAWPSSPNDENNIYPLITTNKLTCKIEMVSGGDVTQACITAAKEKKYTYSTSGNPSVYYDDTYNEDLVGIELEANCSNVTSSVTGSGNDTIVTISNSCQYTLPKNKSIAINKKNAEFIDYIGSTYTDYILITKYNGVLPVGGYTWNFTQEDFSSTIFKEEYALKITNIPLGYNNKFQMVNDTEYVCNYKVTTDVSGECNCPPGTLHNGENLAEYLVEKPQTCEEAKEVYCNQTTCKKPDGTDADITSCLMTNTIEECKKINGCSEYCIKVLDGELADITECLKTKNKATCEEEAGCSTLCPSDSDHPNISYLPCVYGGGSVKYCISKVCYDPCTGPNCYTCPSNTPLYPKDISNCVYKELGKGYDYSEAKSKCISQECYNNTLGNVVYRTISLEVPFVGKSASTSLKSTFINIGLSQGLDLYRYPGSNWNSPSLVYNKIWNNRGYKASELYQEATPLYTINLDPTSIKTIREYNKTHEYSDFTLSCTDGAYCISSFLRSGIKNADKTDILDATASTCANASNKTTFISCYTSK